MSNTVLQKKKVTRQCDLGVEDSSQHSLMAPAAFWSTLYLKKQFVGHFEFPE